MESENEKEVTPPNGKEAFPPSEGSDEAGIDEESRTVNERALIRKIDLRLLPAVTILYLLSFLDRANGES